MFQIKYMHFGLIGVLIVGLVSCAKDKRKTKDVYRPPAVMVLRPHDATHALSRDLTVLDVQDVLSFGPELPERYQVEATCANGAQIYRHTYNADGHQSARLFNILPPELLTLNYAQEHPTCSLIVTEWNELGSSFRQANLVGRAIVDERPQSILLKGDLRPHKDGSYIRIENREKLTAYYDNDQSAQMQLVCGQAKSAPKLFHHSFSLGEIHLAEIMYADRFEARINLPPRQKCRMMVTQNQQFVAASEVFTTLFSLPAVEFKATESVPRPQNLALFEEDRDLAFGQYAMTNSTGFAQTMRVPVNFPVAVESFVDQSATVYNEHFDIRYHFQGFEPWGQVRLWRTSPNGLERMVPTQTATTRLYTILPFESVAIEVLIQGTSHYACTPMTSDVQVPVANVIVRAPNALPIEIEDELGEFNELNPPNLTDILVQRGDVRSANDLHAKYAQTQGEIRCRTLPHE